MENTVKKDPVWRFILILCIVTSGITFYSLGHLVGTTQMAADFKNIYDIEELKQKYNQR